VRITRVVIAALAVGTLCSACFGSSSSSVRRPPPQVFVVGFVPPIGNLEPPTAYLPSTVTRIRCGPGNRSLCAAVVYYATHGPRTCSQSDFSTPAAFGVSGVVDGRRIDEPAVPACRASPRRLAKAEGVLFAALMPRVLQLERAHMAAVLSAAGVTLLEGRADRALVKGSFTPPWMILAGKSAATPPG
jgi:hypothetical protein